MTERGGTCEVFTAHALSVALFGLDPVPVEISATGGPGAGGLIVSGLPEHAARETQVRVTSSLAHLGIYIEGSVSVHVGWVRGDSRAFDLAVACAALAALGKVPSESLAGTVLIGELALSGLLRPARGVLARLKAPGFRRRAIVPIENAQEAGCAPLRAVAVEWLANAIAALQAPEAEPVKPTTIPPASSEVFAFSPEVERYADEITALDKRRILLMGPPGVSLRTLARALSVRLPELSTAATLENMRIHGSAGIMREHPSDWRARPFRAPHHTVSEAGLLGGGVVPRPGEVSIANQGVLLLDQANEFRSSSVLAMRDALDAGEARVYSSQGSASFPARPALVIGTAYPCPCGYRGHARMVCRCTPEARARWEARCGLGENGRKSPIAGLFEVTIRIE